MIKNKYWLKLIMLLIFIVCSIELSLAQKTKVDDMESLSLFMDSIVDKQFYEDVNKDIYLLIMCKVDSVGQILSAHIVESKNFKQELQYMYHISSAIEEKLIARFMYNLLKNKNLIKTSYYYGTFPYRNNRQNSVNCRK